MGKMVHSLAARRAVHCARHSLGLRYPPIGRRQKCLLVYREFHGGECL